MQIILTDDVAGVGDIGETVAVRAGYARNFLIPRGLAIETQAASAKSIAHKMRQIEAKKRQLKSVAEERAKALEALVLEFGVRVGSGGRVFGSVSARQIAEKLQELGYEFDRRRILLVEPIKRVGPRKVKVKLHADVTVEIEVVVNAIAATAQEEQIETISARDSLEASAKARGETAEESDDEEADDEAGDEEDAGDEE